MVHLLAEGPLFGSCFGVTSSGMHPFCVGDLVITVRPTREPAGYAPGVRVQNRWGVEGVIREVSGGHGVCYRVHHLGPTGSVLTGESDFGWYEPDELSRPVTLWELLAKQD